MNYISVLTTFFFVLSAFPVLSQTSLPCEIDYSFVNEDSLPKLNNDIEVGDSLIFRTNNIKLKDEPNVFYMKEKLEFIRKAHKSEIKNNAPAISSFVLKNRNIFKRVEGDSYIIGFLKCKKNKRPVFIEKTYGKYVFSDYMIPLTEEILKKIDSKKVALIGKESDYWRFSLDAEYDLIIHKKSSENFSSITSIKDYGITTEFLKIQSQIIETLESLNRSKFFSNSQGLMLSKGIQPIYFMKDSTLSNIQEFRNPIRGIKPIEFVEFKGHLFLKCNEMNRVDNGNVLWSNSATYYFINSDSDFKFYNLPCYLKSKEDIQQIETERHKEQLALGTKIKSLNWSKYKYNYPIPSSKKNYSPYTPRNRKSYIRGPRGGCYYINSNGKKTYVDRSLCN